MGFDRTQQERAQRQNGSRSLIADR